MLLPILPGFDADLHQAGELALRQADLLPHGLAIRWRDSEATGCRCLALGNGASLLKALHQVIEQCGLHAHSTSTKSRRMAVSLSVRSSFFDFG